MPSNPTVIPGVYGPDFSGLAQLGQSLGQIFNRPDTTLQAGLAELINPETALERGKRMEAAYSKQEALDLQREEAREVAELRRQGLGLKEIDPADQEKINKLADPIGRNIIEAYRAEMFAAGLDPTNPKHFEAARPILDAARSALPAEVRAEVRLGQAPQVVSNLVTTGVNTAEGGAVQSGAIRDVIARQAALRTGITIAEAEDFQAQIFRASREMEAKWRDADSIEEWIMSDPILKKLAEVGGLPAVTEALLKAHAASLEGDFSGIDFGDQLELEATLRVVNTEYVETLIKAQAAGSDEESMMWLSLALKNYQSAKEQIGPYSQELSDTLFPVLPVIAETGTFFKKKVVRILTGLPPADLVIDPAIYGRWLRLIRDDFEANGEATVIERLLGNGDDIPPDPHWARLSKEGRRYVLTQLESANVFLPNLGLERLTQEEVLEGEDNPSAVSVVERFFQAFEQRPAQPPSAGVIRTDPRRPGSSSIHQ